MFVIVEPMFVATAPGAIPLQRMFWSAYMNAVFFVNPTTACFDAV